MFYKDETLAIFIDGPSLSSATRSLDLQVDFRKLLSEFSRRGRLVHSAYYVPMDQSADFNSMRRLADFLSYNGFIVREREYNDPEGGSGFRKALSYLHMEMAIDAMDLSASIDHAVVFCGDAGITPMLGGLQRRGSRVSICSTLRGAHGSVVSDELRRAADNFIDLHDLRDAISASRAAT